MDWQLQDAKNRLSEVPQVVTLRGRRAAVVLSAESHDALLASRPTIVDRLLAGSAWDDGLVETINTREQYPREGAQPPGRVLKWIGRIYLVDTNIISETRRKTPEAVNWLRSVDPAQVYLSVITLGQIMRGITLKQKSDPRAAGHLAE
jgi:hypothetical protein